MQVFRLSGADHHAAAPSPAPVARQVTAAPRPAAPRPAEAAKTAIAQARETSRPVSAASSDDWESF